jgi:enoyl-CoA hydratase
MESVWNLEVEDAVAVLTIDRPPLNLVIQENIVELGEKLDWLRSNPTVRAIILTGSGVAFIGGADITQFEALDPVTAKFGLAAGQRVLREIEELEKPVIAAVNGFAFGGGCEVALACDMRICSEEARFGQLEINYGVMPGWAGTQRLTKIVGLGRAKDMVLTGRIVEPEEAHLMGLVSQVVPAGQLMERARKLAGVLAAKAPVAMALAKELVNAAADCSIPLGGSFEAAACAITMGTEDSVEGVRSFAEKRRPDFKGK